MRFHVFFAFCACVLFTAVCCVTRVVSCQLADAGSAHDIVIAYNLFAFCTSPAAAGHSFCVSLSSSYTRCPPAGAIRDSKTQKPPAGSGPRSGSKNIRPPTVPTHAHPSGIRPAQPWFLPSPATHILLHPFARTLTPFSPCGCCCCCRVPESRLLRPANFAQ